MLTTLQSEEPMFFTKFHHGSFVYQGFYDADEEAGCLLLVCRPPRSLSAVDLTSANTQLYFLLARFDFCPAASVFCLAVVCDHRTMD